MEVVKSKPVSDDKACRRVIKFLEQQDQTKDLADSSATQAAAFANVARVHDDILFQLRLVAQSLSNEDSDGVKQEE